MSDDRQRVTAAMERLDAQALRSLADYAEFLAARGAPVQPSVSFQSAPPAPPAEKPVATPLPRPERESVVAALKRLSASYPMLDKSKMLNKTSTLMTQHVMQGRDSVEIIDELETIFVAQYRVWRGEATDE